MVKEIENYLFVCLRKKKHKYNRLLTIRQTRIPRDEKDPVITNLDEIRVPLILSRRDTMLRITNKAPKQKKVDLKPAVSNHFSKWDNKMLFRHPNTQTPLIPSEPRCKISDLE